MKDFLLQFFTWWNGQTLGTRFFTWRKGEFVGEDELGNRYFRAPSAIPDSIRERRWVIYKGYAEASAIPPGWHGWMHHRVETPPSESAYRPRDWEKPHHANLTGTALAYRPPGSIATPQPVSAAEPDYEAWRPH
ncbi:MAG: NADH:ubiquinone oxidoreductase subunit NDUFA12 [Parvibaculaceae bacterium]